MQEPSTETEDLEGPPRGGRSKAEAEPEMALWALVLAGPQWEVARPRLALTFSELAKGLPVLGRCVGEGRSFCRHLLPGVEEQGGGMWAGEEAHEMSQGLI